MTDVANLVARLRLDSTGFDRGMARAARAATAFGVGAIAIAAGGLSLYTARQFDAVDATAKFFDKLFALDSEISVLLDESPPLPPTGMRENLRTRGLLARAQHLDAPFESHDLRLARELDPAELPDSVGSEDKRRSDLEGLLAMARFALLVLGLSVALAGCAHQCRRRSGRAVYRKLGVLAVAQASMRVDQLRWLAVKQPPVRFPDRVVTRIKAWATNDGRQVRREAPVRLTSGRQRPVTVQVSSANKAAYVQAVSGRDQEQAAELFASFRESLEARQQRREPRPLPCATTSPGAASAGAEPASIDSG
mgnify:CR=1 FL=1